MLQGDVVRQLKQDSRPELEVKAAIAELKKRKKLLEQKVIHVLHLDLSLSIHSSAVLRRRS